ncbi:PilZ domain-containing protein [Kordiimonas aquimaris]|uniref:PilZ domain-containing protein n=1 Tax=Kordiimonas aquimaris TaxID=707591 RepID=UPI0021D2D0C2|nr:PilZ domain-containing protein [Kordiimonas aquimaris]
MREKNTAEMMKPEQHANTFQGGSADARAYRRRSVLWPATLKVGQHTFVCQIWNMSLGGARIKMDLPLRDGASVMLVIAGRGDIPACVSWCEDGEAGLEFVIPADEVRILFLDRAQSLGFERFDGPKS